MKPKDSSEIFRRLGLSKYAAVTYEATQSSRGISVAAIARHVGTHRPVIYRALDELLRVKLIARVRLGKRLVYTAMPWKRVTALFSQVEKQVQAIAPKDANDNGEEIQRTIRLLHGALGIKKVFDDIVEHTKRGDTFFRYTSERDLDKVNSYLSKNYRKIRDQKRLERLVISNPISGSRKKPRLERFIKYIPREASLFDQNIIQIIYGERIAFIDLNTEEAFIIENAAMAEFQKVIFRQLYRSL